MLFMKKKKQQQPTTSISKIILNTHPLHSWANDNTEKRGKAVDSTMVVNPGDKLGRNLKTPFFVLLKRP